MAIRIRDFVDRRFCKLEIHVWKYVKTLKIRQLFWYIPVMVLLPFDLDVI